MIPWTYSEALLEAWRLAKENEQLLLTNSKHKEEIKVLTPKADFHDLVCKAEGDIDIPSFAKIMWEWPNQVMGWLKDTWYIEKKNWKNKPLQRWINEWILRYVYTWPQYLNFEPNWKAVIVEKYIPYFIELYKTRDWKIPIC